MVRERGHGPSGWHTGGATGWAGCQGEKTNAKRVGSVSGGSQTSPVPLQTLEREPQGQIHAGILARGRYNMMDGGAAAGPQDATAAQPQCSPSLVLMPGSSRHGAEWTLLSVSWKGG